MTKYDPYADGVVEFAGEGFKLERDKRGGKLTCTWRLRCLDEDQEGSILEKRYYLDSEGGKRFFRKEMEKLGIDVTETGKLKGRLAETRGLRVKISVKIGDSPWPSYYLQEVCGRNPKK